MTEPFTGPDGADRQITASEYLELEELLLTRPDTPPCPPWCTLAPGHAYESVDIVGKQHERSHEAFKANNAGVSAWEYSRAGVARVQPLTVDVWADEGAEMSARAAREVAAEIIAAADKLDELAAQGFAVIS